MKRVMVFVMIVLIVVLTMVAVIAGSRVDDNKSLQLFKALARTENVEIVSERGNGLYSSDTTYQLRINDRLASGRCTGSIINRTTCIITWMQ